MKPTNISRAMLLSASLLVSLPAARAEMAPMQGTGMNAPGTQQPMGSPSPGTVLQQGAGGQQTTATPPAGGMGAMMDHMMPMMQGMGSQPGAQVGQMGGMGQQMPQQGMGQQPGMPQQPMGGTGQQMPQQGMGNQQGMPQQPMGGMGQQMPQQGWGYPPGMPQQPMGGMGWGRMIPMMPQTMMRRMAIEHGMSGMDLGAIGMLSAPHIEAWLAYGKAALAISDVQLPQWNTFADAARNSLRALRENYDQIVRSGKMASATDQADLRIKILTARIEAEKTMAAARKALYAVLSDVQRKFANELFDEPI